ncbi:MAG: NAD(P)H-hydrate dehydratase [Bacteroidaceae bacterium]|nr:NAD(P)H-hydrate dehydratase [Bacteroidaceae bacterium]
MKCTEGHIVPHYLLSADDIRHAIPPRTEDSHKGTFGHGLLVAGQYGMAGAAILSAKACMRSGIGKLTIRTQPCNAPILQTSVPEAILDISDTDGRFSQPVDDSGYSAVAIGCGLGTATDTQDAFIRQIRTTTKPLVIDADGLNILSLHKELIGDLPSLTILTPHRGELRRLIGPSVDADEELAKTVRLSATYGLVIVMKGPRSRTVTPQGAVYVNPTGNPGMATAGSGDVLTGIILALLSQGADPVMATQASVFIHGLAGDLAAKEKGEVSLLASDIVECLPQAFMQVAGCSQS